MAGNPCRPLQFLEACSGSQLSPVVPAPDGRTTPLVARNPTSIQDRSSVGVSQYLPGLSVANVVHVPSNRQHNFLARSHPVVEQPLEHRIAVIAPR
jgi:hypothetical protein